jgi:hypothetical protein
MRLTKQTFSMQIHDAASRDDEATLTLELVNAGAGEYLVITAQNWAIETDEEADQIATEAKNMLKKALV